MKFLTHIVLSLLLAHATAGAAAPGTSAEMIRDTPLAPSAGRFLVAQRSLYGPWFGKTVVYLLTSDREGAVGVIVNRPLNRQAYELLPGMQSSEMGSYPLFTGGPVSKRKLIMLLKGDFDSDMTLQVSDGIYASSNIKMLAHMVVARKPENEIRLFLGQSIWQPGQLADEIDNDYWYVAEGDPDAIFADETGDLWRKLINQLDPQGIMARR